MSSTRILQPSCSPKKLTLLPTTGPRSSSTGDSREVSEVRNFRSALVAKTGSADVPGAAAAGCSSVSTLRVEMRSSRPTSDLRESTIRYGQTIEDLRIVGGVAYPASANP